MIQYFKELSQEILPVTAFFVTANVKETTLQFQLKYSRKIQGSAKMLPCVYL